MPNKEALTIVIEEIADLDGSCHTQGWGSGARPLNASSPTLQFLHVSNMTLEKLQETANFALSQYPCCIGMGFSGGCTGDAKWCQTHKPTTSLLDILGEAMMQVVVRPIRL